ncbi:hypothetical protein [Dasineura jujubifolia toursvirus 2a]|nr:hypothetical protein [Dasineura jujubifolia toursvirus 2a]
MVKSKLYINQKIKDLMFKSLEGLSLKLKERYGWKVITNPKTLEVVEIKTFKKNVGTMIKDPNINNAFLELMNKTKNTNINVLTKLKTAKENIEKLKQDKNIDIKKNKHKSEKEVTNHPNIKTTKNTKKTTSILDKISQKTQTIVCKQSNLHINRLILNVKQIITENSMNEYYELYEYGDVFLLDKKTKYVVGKSHNVDCDTILSLNEDDINLCRDLRLIPMY